MIPQSQVRSRFGFQRERSGHGFWEKSLRKLTRVSRATSASLVGLDIGSTAIKVVQLKQDQQSLSLEGFGVERVPVFTDREGPRHQHNWLLHAIKELFSTCGIHQKNVAVSLSGASVIIKRIDLPPMKVQEVEGYLTWEGSQHVPFEMDEVCWDYHPILAQELQASGNEVRSVFLFAAKRKAVENLQRVVLEAGLRPVVFDVTVVALSNMYVMTHASKIDGLVLLVNIEEQYLNKRTYPLCCYQTLFLCER